MLEPRRLQRLLKASLAAQSDPSRVGPYTTFFHATSPYAELNVAVPDEPGDGRRVPVLGQDAAGLGAVPDDDPEYALVLLRAAFHARRRTPRVEFVLGCHPELPRALARGGFHEVSRAPLLACTRETWRAAAEVEGLRFQPVLPETPWSTTRRYLEVQREAFGLDLPVPEHAPADAWASLGLGAAVLALRGDTAVGAGGFSAPHDGLCEARGLAVVPHARRQGVGTFLLSALARVAHDGGVEALVAVPDDADLARLAKRAGFEAVDTLVAFRAEGAAAP